MKQNPTTKPSNSASGRTSDSASGLTAKRSIDEIIVHCTATKAGQSFDVEDVRRWHLQRNFRDIGYHFLVLLDGTVQQGRTIAEVGAHCTGHNTRSIGVCYVGGLAASGSPADTRTPQQRKALRNLLTDLKRRFPKAVIHGHCDFVNKACPCFNATKEYQDL